MSTALTSCTAPQPETEFSGDETFRTTDPSRLFFMNVRSSSYYYERPKGTDLDLYRNRKFSQTAKRPILIPIIINAWAKHEAYFFVKPNDFESIANPLVVRWATADSTGLLSMGNPDRAEQYRFANAIYTYLYEGRSLEVMLSDSSFHPIFEERSERAAYLGTTLDYYRLTEKI